jgi:hypothetical protein
MGVCFSGTSAAPPNGDFSLVWVCPTGAKPSLSGTITTIGTTQTLPFEIQAGTGTQYRLGADYRFADRLTLQGSIGRAVSDPMGMNGSLTFTVTPR